MSVLLAHAPAMYKELFDRVDDRVRDQATCTICEIEEAVCQCEKRLEICVILGQADLVTELQEARDRLNSAKALLSSFLLEVAVPTPMAALAVVVVEAPELTDLPEETAPPEVEIVAPAIEVTPTPPSAVSVPRTALLRTTRRQLATRRSAFQSEASRLDSGERGAAWRARLKAAACLGRGVLCLAESIGDEDGAVETILCDLQDTLAGAGEDWFPAFSGRLAMDPDRWFECADAYWNVAVAEECLMVLEEKEAMDGQEDNLLMLCAAAQAEAFRRLPGTDTRLMEMRDRIERIKPEELYVPYWKLAENGGPTTNEVASDAKQLSAAWRAYKSRKNKTTTQQAGERFREALRSEDPMQEILAAAQEALDGGVPPSNKLLRENYLPYRVYLEGLTGPHAAKFLDYLRRDETLRTAKADPSHEVDVEEYPEYAEQLEAVRSRLKGKRVLLIGGRTDAHRKRALEDALELKELCWPDTTEDTKVSSFGAAVRNADLVCLSIRWSRHAYKMVLDEAREQGKETAVIKAGIGLRRFVYDLYHQPGNTSTAEPGTV